MREPRCHLAIGNTTNTSAYGQTSFRRVKLLIWGHLAKISLWSQTTCGPKFWKWYKDRIKSWEFCRKLGVGMTRPHSSHQIGREWWRAPVIQLLGGRGQWTAWGRGSCRALLYVDRASALSPASIWSAAGSRCRPGCSKERRTGPGRKRSRQKSPCRAVAGSRPWIGSVR